MARRSAGKGKKKTETGKAFKSTLAKLKKQWNNARAESKKVGTFPGPDGTYAFKLFEAEIREGAGKMGVHVFLNFECQNENYKGDAIAIRRSVEDEDRLVWLQRDLRRLGVEVDEVGADELETVLEELVADQPFVVGRVVTSGEWQNLQLQRLVDEDELEELVETLDEELGVTAPDEKDEDEDEDETEDEDEDEDEDETEDEDEDEDAPDDGETGYEVGDDVEGEFDGDWFPGKVKSVAPGKGKKSILVVFEDGEKGNYGPDSEDLRQSEAGEDEDEDEEEIEVDVDEDDDSDSDDDEDEREITKGDRLWWEDKKGNENFGKVTAVKGDIVTVKPDGKKKTVKLDTNDVDVELLDDED